MSATWWKLWCALAQTPEAVGEVINIGNDQEVTINELAALVKRSPARHRSVEHVPYDQAYGPGFEDMPRRVPCLEKAGTSDRHTVRIPHSTPSSGG